LDTHDKIFWHGAFFESLQLELHDYKEHLKLQNEYQLSKEALRIDALVIKKNKGVYIDKNIGRIFRGHNLFEFKSESDSLSVWDYNKVFGYAYQYSFSEHVSELDITLSIALTMYPRELIKHLKNERGLKVQNLGDGIHYIEGEVFPVQILEIKRLSPEKNIFLRNLRSNLSAEDISKAIQLGKEYGLLDKSVYLERLIKANLSVFMEAIDVTESVMEIFMEGARKYGWLDKEIEQKIEQIRMQDREETAKKIEQIRAKTAKKMLMRGDSVEEVAEIMELPIETVMGLQ